MNVEVFSYTVGENLGFVDRGIYNAVAGDQAMASPALACQSTRRLPDGVVLI